MASPKAAYYTTHLYTALTAGEWGSATPSKALFRSGLSWPEVLRKFRKHCPLLRDVSEIASQTQGLSLLLTRSQPATPDALDGDHTNPEEPLTLGEECLLPEEHHAEAESAYKTLQKLPQTDPSRLALAYFAFALGRYNDTLSHISSLINSEDSSSLNASNFGSVASALSVPVSRDTRTAPNSPTASFTPSVTALEVDIKEGKVWGIIERIRGRCLEGMAHESLQPPSLSSAMSAYDRALPLLDAINIPKSLPVATGKASVESFTRYRELWRWAERLLWRASVLSAKTRPAPQILPLLRAYQAHSIHWPATFRPEHRSTIAQLHLHVLIQTYTPTAKFSWLNETRSIVNDYRIVLTATTKFPRAGQRNTKVETFVDLCMAAWEVSGASGEQTGWVIDVLWWATRFTFNSHRIYRHLTRTLYVSGDTELARRTLRLYVQVVSKSHEMGECVEEDRIWTETLIQGARMLCRMPGGVDEAREAGELIQKATERHDAQDNVTAAALKRAEGVWHACMALREQEPVTRPEHFAASLAALVKSLALHPTPSTHFHLALALARAGPSRDLISAIASAREAVEGDPKEMRYWHLLGLLLAATEDWKGAKGVLDFGAQIADGDDQDGSEEPMVDGKDHVNGHGAPEGANSWRDSRSHVRGCLLEENALQLPAGAMLQRLVPDYPLPTRHERFEHALQLRLTQLALVEHVDGPENAGAKWVEVFSWIAERRGLGEERRPLSVEPPPSEGNASDPANRSPHLHPSTALTLSRTHSPPDIDANSDIPINLIPPSPQEHVGQQDVLAETTEKLDPNFLQDKDGHDTSKGKKVQRILKERVHKGQVHIHSISRKIGRGGGRQVNRLKRSNSAPDFQAVLSNSKPYQASSIHSRQLLSATYMRPNSPDPPPPPTSPQQQPSINAGRSARERRLLSNLWLTSAATFRRMGKIEQAKAAIQEAEVADEENEDVWVQLGLYFAALGQTSQAIESFHKALFISPEHVPAFVHLAQQYLAPAPVSAPLTSGSTPVMNSAPSRDNIDLAAGLLSDLTRGGGWDVPEAWYFLARANGLQGKPERERECLSFALGLAESRGVRDIKTAVGWCL